ncbi:MAG: hypothetical protein ABSB73_03135 [Solirubrobacteraceae bacterium]|jgi:hypothetical protein
MVLRSRPRGRRAAVGALIVVIVLACGVDAALAAHRAVTRSDALAIATAINVRQGDVPKLKQQSNPITATEVRQQTQLTGCVGGVPTSDAFANTQSPNFASLSGTSVTLNSGTEILPSAALVAKDFAAVTGPRGLPCLLADLRTELVGKPAKDETVKSYASHLTADVSGADDAFADRFAVIITVTHKTTTLILPLYVDLVGFTYGQAEVSLSVESVGAKPSTALEHRLVALLVARAHSAIG